MYNFMTFLQSSTTATVRGHPFKLFTEYCDVNATKSFYINVWNSLPSDNVDFSALWSFKRTVKLVDLSTFLKM